MKSRHYLKYRLTSRLDLKYRGYLHRFIDVNCFIHEVGIKLNSAPHRLHSVSSKFNFSNFCLRRIGTTAILAGVSAVLTSDPIHKVAQVKFREMFGYPSWFVPCVGLWEAGIVYLNVYGGSYQWLAQKMLAVLMGGSIYSHYAVEGNFLASLNPFAWLVISCAVKTKNCKIFAHTIS